ncbi:acylphosphatase [Prosthecobacter vanneervenii]|uniref:acylphosphatase n=1 Tax=Prosthecobacter vanneervenii TaxID=48466 RepID=A0A7W8DK81_9BACT|nr:acylphosphatase [Prosthecobacter vanneervenii]MBB5032958.1 acylphosphatase [Prosthecobacter vanneervenii]
MMTAKHVFYSGRVQGVGFRYSTKRIASGFDVTGWVKNLPDGRVEMLAQSFEPDELDAFLEDIQTSSLGSHIKEREVNSIAAQPGLRGFSIVA